MVQGADGDGEEGRPAPTSHPPPLDKLEDGGLLPAEERERPGAALLPYDEELEGKADVHVRILGLRVALSGRAGGRTIDPLAMVALVIVVLALTSLAGGCLASAHLTWMVPVLAITMLTWVTWVLHNRGQGGSS